MACWHIYQQNPQVNWSMWEIVVEKFCGKELFMIRKELSGNCIDTRFLMSSFITDQRDLKLIVYLFSGVVEEQKKYPKIKIENKFNIVGRREEYLNSSDKICLSTYIFIRQETTQRRKC